MSHDTSSITEKRQYVEDMLRQLCTEFMISERVSSYESATRVEQVRRCGAVKKRDAEEFETKLFFAGFENRPQMIVLRNALSEMHERYPVLWRYTINRYFSAAIGKPRFSQIKYAQQQDVTEITVKKQRERALDWLFGRIAEACQMQEQSVDVANHRRRCQERERKQTCE